MLEENETQETSLQDLIDLVERDDLPTNEFTSVDNDPMVILGKLNEVIAYLQTLQTTINASDSKANEALQKAIQAVADATQALSVANGIDAKATQALANAIEAVGTANTALNAGTTALGTANTAILTANTALNSADSAVETAEDALDTAESAETKADTAITTANGAKTTAEGIDAKATTALSNSQSAVSTANTAETKAQEAIDQLVTGLGTKVYRDSELLSSLDIKPIEDDIADNTTAITALQNNLTDIPTKLDDLIRINKKGYISSGSQYFELVTLPINNSYNYASVIFSGRIGGWTGTADVAYFTALLSNRTHFTADLITASIEMLGKFEDALQKATIVAYKQADLSTKLYLKASNYYTFDFSFQKYQSTVTYDYTGTAVTPTGTLIWDMATTPKFAVDTTGQISNGTYKYYLPESAGTLALTSQLPTLSSLGITALQADLSSNTTAITALQNGKVDKVTGKGLSTEDYTTAEKTMLSGLSNYDDTQVQADITALQNNKEEKLAGNFSETGYIKYKSGLIIQWGRTRLTGNDSDSDQSANFAGFNIAFPTACLSVVAIMNDSNLSYGYNNSINLGTITTTGVYIKKNFTESKYVRYIAVGY